MASESKTGAESIVLPALPYAEDALEPHIDKITMHKHHKFHHNGYTGKFKDAYTKFLGLQNAALAEIQAGSAQGVLTDASLKAIAGAGEPGLAGALRNNGGGFYNHTLFWNNMAPPASGGGGAPAGALASAIDAKFGSFDAFKTEFATAGATRFGSGWVWLVKNSEGLKLYSTPNQDGPHNTPGETPLLGLDVWEHAYYLKYQNDRGGYIKAWWNVVNWPEVQNRFDNAQ